MVDVTTTPYSFTPYVAENVKSGPVFVKSIIY